MKNQVQLITYADRLGGGRLSDLHALLKGPLAGVFATVHILPFFDPIDGADAGFDPVDHTHVDPRLGGWPDLAAMTRDIEVMADVIVNHVSTDSPQFLDHAEKGASSEYAGMFLDFDRVFPNGARSADLLALYRPRPGLPFTAMNLKGAGPRLMWTTFTSKQVDIDVEHPQGQAYLLGILKTLSANGIRQVRLDAVGYAIKRGGQSCFMMPETFEFIDAFSAQARALGMEVLVELHAHYRTQVEVASRVDWVYDFALPPLLLHVLTFSTTRALKQWLRVRPANAVTVLDTHDGIGIIDIRGDGLRRAERPGLVPDDELDTLVETIHQRTRGQSRQATGAAASNVDLYQVNCTFFDAMGRDACAYLLARAIQFFMPGIPQVYYVGLLAGGNDMALLQRTGVGRDINRHHYTRQEIEADLEQPVVKSLLALIRLRNAHPAFQGRFAWRDGSTPDSLVMTWTADSAQAHFAELHVNADHAVTHELVFSAAAGVLEHWQFKADGTLAIKRQDPGVKYPVGVGQSG